MSWWGKLLGGAFGFMIGGPIGALVGVALGHNFDRGLQTSALPPPGGGVNPRERAQMAFFTATFSVMGHIAKADGRVTPHEIQLATQLMEQMGLTRDMRAAAKRLFNEGKAPDFPMEEVLAQLRRECRRSANLMRMFLEIQLHAAYSDGRASARERGILYRACEALGVSGEEFARLEARVQAELNMHASGGSGRPGSMSLDAAYAILDVSEQADDQAVKRAYRRQMSQHHPDKLVAKGLPEEMMKLATEKTQEIKAAYERIREARGS